MDNLTILNRKRTRFGRMTQPIAEFMHYQSSSGVLLIICTAIAMFAANSPAYEGWDHFWHTPVGLELGSWSLKMSLAHWINDGLMTIFFFVVGLEIKREVVKGELSNPRNVVLPIVGAIGGAVLPALIYIAIERGTDAIHGWAIPMATDIAFVVGALALLGDRVPKGLKIFLLSLAIVDDMMAVLVIALFYTSSLAPEFLAVAVAGLMLIVALQKLEVRSVTIYFIVGAVVWYFTYRSGIHPTIAGVAIGLMTPSGPFMPRERLTESLNAFTASDGSELGMSEEEFQEWSKHIASSAIESISPMERLEHDLHPWNSFFIMPVFALANAGVPISMGMIGDKVAIAIAAGLILGKPVGIVLASLIAVVTKIATLPRGVTWPVLAGGGMLAGIGFTMSLFIAGLSFEGDVLLAGKSGVLLGSTISAVLGYVLLFVMLRNASSDESDSESA